MSQICPKRLLRIFIRKLHFLMAFYMTSPSSPLFNVRNAIVDAPLVMKTQICAWLTCEVCRNESKFILNLEHVRNVIDKFGIANLYLAPSKNKIWRGRNAKAPRIKKYRTRLYVFQRYLKVKFDNFTGFFHQQYVHVLHFRQALAKNR